MVEFPDPLCVARPKDDPVRKLMQQARNDFVACKGLQPKSFHELGDTRRTAAVFAA